MFDLSFSEIAVIAILILVCFDVEQLPGLMRQAGRMYAKVRSASDDLRRVFNAEVARADADHRRIDLEKRREEVIKLRNARRPAPSAVPARPAPDDAVMRPGPARPTMADLSAVSPVTLPPTNEPEGAVAPDAPAPSAVPSADPADDSGGER